MVKQRMIRKQRYLVYDRFVTKNLYEYMKERAKSENVKFDLDLNFFEMNYRLLGVKTFFGVTIDNNGKILQDIQNPVFFVQYFYRSESQ